MDQTSNRYLAQAPIGPLMLKFAVPCILSLLVSSLYNIVDQIFIGQGVGYLGNGATNVVFPITVIALAAALMIGDGCAAFLSICQGQNDTENAHRSVGNAITLLLLCSVVLVVLFAVFRDSILAAFGATENNLSYAIDYFNIIIIGIPFYILTNGINSIIRADGSPKFAMMSTLVGCIMNVILDPIAIFVLHWGVTGAALATIAGQIVSTILGIGYLFRARSFRLQRNSFRLRGKLMAKILPLGVSSLLTQLSIVIIMGVMNTTLVKYGAQSEYGADIPMTVVGIVMKVFQIVIAFVVGVAAGCQPIVGYNYGAGNGRRVRQIFKTMMLTEAAIGVISTLAFQLFPVQIISLFGSESELYNRFAGYSFRIFLSTILLCCLHKAISIFLQSLGKPVQSMTLSLLRDFVLCVPLVLLLPLVVDPGVMGPLYSAPVADVLTLLVAVVMMAGVWKRLDRMQERSFE
ncbi:MAG: MATE family efflux transporter [Gemmiger sp.]|uniref:MATE family efflux transporter n=1 Tax=Gemmiger sp. TaxID=2049027 RepID=UPI002E7A25ED|nr:MATE family efflux transporter [Gemmiger sp.]MEE0801751.1 MATE family efflux transporter [Gemmiger sp.]